MPRISRRRFIAISAAVAALPRTAFSAAPDAGPVTRWRGIALGAGASMTLAGIGEHEAAPVIAQVQSEIDRLESIFSLYRAKSALSRFNRTGHLTSPPPELLELLTLCGTIHHQTGGAFDPTIQPLWALHAEAAAARRVPSDAEIATVCARTGWAGIRFDTRRVVAIRPGMALTLNGIAQGYIADRIADLLRAEGMAGVLVDMGEIHAVGAHADGTAWRVGLATPGRNTRSGAVALVDRALATSAPYGTVLDGAGHIGHIVDPRTGRPGGLWRQVSVSAPRAALADGLSTAFCLMPHDLMERTVAAHPEARIESVL
jgi:thiamine biosynthesis lipoprotein